MAELPPLKLEAARFATLCRAIATDDSEKWTTLAGILCVLRRPLIWPRFSPD